MTAITSISRRSSIVPAPHPVRTDRATLTLLTSDAAGQAFELHRDRPTTLGRDPNVDVVIDDPTVSRSHARITRTMTPGIMSPSSSSTWPPMTLPRGRRVSYDGYRTDSLSGCA